MGSPFLCIEDVTLVIPSVLEHYSLLVIQCPLPLPYKSEANAEDVIHMSFSHWNLSPSVGRFLLTGSVDSVASHTVPSRDHKLLLPANNPIQCVRLSENAVSSLTLDPFLIT